MINLHELCLFLDNELEPHKFKDFAPNGLQVEGQANISKIGVAVSSSLDTIEKAANMGVQALIVHHGLYWKNQCFLPKNVLRKKLELLFSTNMSLIAYHLPLDANEDVGNNWEAARRLGWSELKAFPEHENNAIGVKGKVAPTLVKDFQKDLEEFYQHQAHVALGNRPEIERVALISGGAHWQLQDAIDEGLDAFITGSFDEPIWNLAKESGVHFFALGHHATERIGVQALGSLVEEHFDGVKSVFIDSDNPF